MTPVEKVLDRVRDPKQQRDYWMAFCPAHPDGQNNPQGRSLKIAEGTDGRALISCKAGCPYQNVVDSLGLTKHDLFVDEKPLRPRKAERAKPVGQTQWEIKNYAGELVGIHHRIDLEDGGKRIWWSTPEGEKKMSVPPSHMPLYLSETIPDSHSPVVLVEGEKAADALAAHGFNVVGTVCGASETPSEDVLAFLQGRDIIVWPDNDEPGRSHMRRICEVLVGLANTIRVFKWAEAPKAGDAADHPDLSSLPVTLSNAPAYRPKRTIEKGAVSFGAYISQEMDTIKSRIANEGITGISTSIRKMDTGLHGLNAGQSVIVAARTNQGKSLFAGQLGLTSAEQDHRTILFTLEQSPLIYLDRYIHKVAGVSYERGVRGRLSEQEVKKLAEAADYVASLPLLVSGGSKTVSEIRQLVELHDPELVIVDYIQKVKADDTRAPRNQQVGQISRDLQSLKDDLDVALVLAAQINRAPELRNDKEPYISDIRDSGEIENDADAICILHNEYRAGVEGAIPGRIKINCAKFRFGRTWWTRVQFMPEQNWLMDIPDGEDNTDMNLGGE